jgi:hypothetical protein
MKKAQGISINTIVIAAIALVVMILIVMIFTGNLGKWRKSEDSCQTNGGACIPAIQIGSQCSGDYQRVRTDFVCYGADGERDPLQACCVSS